MAIDYQSLLARAFPERRQSYDGRDCILYALGLGLGSDPLAPAELAHVYEAGLQALPTMATVIGQPGFWIAEPDTGIDHSRVVHGEQSLVVHAPLAAAGELVGRTRIVDIVDKGAGRGALLRLRTQLHDALTDRLQSTLVSTIFCRGDGGFGGPAGTAPAAEPMPETVPDHRVLRPIPMQAALIYRLSGDLNPLHADPAAAILAGFDRPILHGLATYGLAGFALQQARGQRDAASLQALSCRFTAPIFPGETLRTDIWRSGDDMIFRSVAVERDVVVLDRGRASFGLF